MPPSRQGGLSQERDSQGLLFHLSLTLAGPCLLPFVPCTARFVGPNYNMQGGLAPDVEGGEFLFGRIFVSFPFRAALGGRWGWRLPVPGRCTGL